MSLHKKGLEQSSRHWKPETLDSPGSPGLVGVRLAACLHQMEMEDPFLSDLTMPGKLEMSNGYADDLERDFTNNEDPAEAPVWPYNERSTNATNASIAVAMSGRTNRTHFSAGLRIPSAAGRQQNLLQSPLKVLDLIRTNLQKFINQEIHVVIQRYVKDYFEPAMENIRNNSGADSITEDHLNELLCSVLEEAKRMYEPVPVAVFPPMAYHASTASPYSNISEGEKWQEPFSRYGQRKESDGDSYSSGSSAKRQKTDKPKTKLTTPQRKTVATPKFWSGVVDINSIDENTRFILGSAANKVLGYGAARGRIYVKHPDLFKYVGDQEDKQWLFENRIMIAAGGKAFLVFSDDIRAILRTEDVSVKRGSMNAAKEFTIPPFMLKKLQHAAAQYSGNDNRSRSGSSGSNISQGSRALTEPDMNLDVEGDSEGSSGPGQEEQHAGPSAMQYGDTTDGRSDPFNGTDSPGGGFRFSPLNGQDVFDNDNDVFAHDDHEFSNGLSLDAINPTIGALDHGHELNHLDF